MNYLYTGILHLLYFPLLYFIDTMFLTNWRQSCVDKVYQSYFSNSICSLNISVSHFGNSLNMPNIFIIMLLTVICDPVVINIILQKDYLLKTQMVVNIFFLAIFFQLRYVHFWGHNSISHLRDYSTV